MHQPVYYNPSARSWNTTSTANPSVLAFHRTLPSFQTTPLTSLPSLAAHLSLDAVYLKDETSRLGLPSFKILGASWASCQAVAKLANLPDDASLDEVAAAARAHNVRFVAATDGNHGRAVARMAKIFGVQATVFVPKVLDHQAKDFISEEGAEVRVVDADYDGAVEAAVREAENEGGMLIQDTAFEGHEEVKWVLEGYSTMLFEIDSQLAALSPPVAASHLVVPVGVGSLAQAVTTHAKSSSRSPATAVIAVEPTRAACLHASLVAGSSMTVETSNTIMSGMNCGSVSSAAWPVLKKGVDVSVTVSEIEAHEACVYLEDQGVQAGPCGAATLAALRRLVQEGKDAGGLTEESVVVLICSEAKRHYVIPSGDQSETAATT